MEIYDDIPFMERTLEEFRSGLNENMLRMKFWKFLFYSALSGILLFDLAAVVVRFVPDSPWLPVLSLGGMVISFFAMRVTSCRWKFWKRQTDIWRQSVSKTEIQLDNAYHTQENLEKKES